MAASSPEPALPRTVAVRPIRRPAGAALLVALLLAAAYAAFAGGAVRVPEETWLQVAVAVLGVLAATAWLGPGALRPRATPAAVAGLLLLALFAVWTGLSLVWSVAPDRTWIETNRALAYALVVAIALAAARSVRRPAERVAAGWLVIAVAVALYAIAGKVVPGVLDHARAIARLRAPLEYWNALALVCVLGAPVALRFATAVRLRPRWRIAALLALFLLLCCLGMTYSRGGMLALGAAIVVVTAVGGGRLRGVAAFAVAALAALPVLGVAWTDDVLSANGAPLDEQIDAGGRLGAWLVGMALLLAGAGWLLLRAERRVRWSPRRSARAWGAAGVLAIAVAAFGIAAMVSAEGGVRGTIERAADSFTEVRRDPIYEPGRLLTTSSGNRWAWWREAAGAWSDEPVLGWGAGSFPVSRRLYRVSPNDVLQPHSVPLQFLAETGLVGAALALGGLALLFGAAAARVLRMPGGRERELSGALLAGAAAWAVHALLDWDWDIPGVTVPVLIFLGVLCARPPLPRPPSMLALGEPRPGRAIALAGTGLLACAAIASAILPAWSDARTDAALAATSDRSPDALADAAADAEVAARLDPLAVRPLFAAAAVAQARGRLLEARAHLLDAVERQPYSLEAWTRLTRVALALADRPGVERASARALALDPGDVALTRFVSRAQGAVAPPEASPTAVGTPLLPAPGAAAPPATTAPPLPEAGAEDEVAPGVELEPEG